MLTASEARAATNGTSTGLNPTASILDYILALVELEIIWSAASYANKVDIDLTNRDTMPLELTNESWYEGIGQAITYELNRRGFIVNLIKAKRKGGFQPGSLAIGILEVRWG